MRATRKFIVIVGLATALFVNSCTMSDEQPEDEFSAADSGNQVVDTPAPEVAASEIPSPEGVAAQATEAAAEGEVPAGEPVSEQEMASGPQLSEQTAQTDSAIHPVPEQAQPVPAAPSSLPSLSQTVAETETEEQANQVAERQKRPAARMAEQEGNSSGNGPAYIVQPGDTLGLIAKTIYGDASRWQELAQLNGLEAASLIFPGDVIRYSEDQSAQAFNQEYSALPKLTITVKKGDTLYSIAARHLGSPNYWKLLWRWNADLIQEPNQIAVGQTLEYVSKEELTAFSAERRGVKEAH